MQLSFQGPLHHNSIPLKALYITLVVLTHLNKMVWWRGNIKTYWR